MEILAEDLKDYVEAFGLEDAQARVNSPSALRVLDVGLEELATVYTRARTTLNGICGDERLSNAPFRAGEV